MLWTVTRKLVHRGGRSRFVGLTAHNVVKVDIQASAFPRRADLLRLLRLIVGLVVICCSADRRQEVCRWCHTCSEFSNLRLGLKTNYTRFRMMV